MTSPILRITLKNPYRIAIIIFIVASLSVSAAGEEPQTGKLTKLIELVRLPDTFQALWKKVHKHFKADEFDKALIHLDKIEETNNSQCPDSPLSDEFYKTRALCQYYLGNYSAAVSTLKDGIKQHTNNHGMYLLLAQIYYDRDQYKEASLELEYFLSAAYEWRRTDSKRKLLANVYEDMALKDQMHGDYKSGREYIDRALAVLKQSDEAGRKKAAYSSEIRRRINFLERLLTSDGNTGISTSEMPREYTKNDLFKAAMPHLTPLQQEKLKYPFEIDDAMRAWAKRELSGIDSEILKARKLLRLMNSELSLNVKDAYDQLENKQKGFWLGRTAKEVFNERFVSGNPEIIPQEGIKYRYGDCESETNLYIALARAAGLKAFMVRIFTDLDIGYIGQHRAAGVFTDDGKLIIIDLTWYRSAGVPYTNYRILNDMENFSYYLTGYNNISEDGHAFLRTSLAIDPHNELSLVDLAARAIDGSDYDMARQYLDRVPENARGYQNYWLQQSRIWEEQDNRSEALKILEESTRYVRNAPKILSRRGMIHYQMKDIDTAYRLLKASTDIPSYDQGEAWRAIAEIELERKKYKDAIYAYKRSALFTVENAAEAKSCRGIADVYFSQGDFSKALDYYNKAWTGFQEAPVHWRKKELIKQNIAKIKIHNQIRSISGSAKTEAEIIKMIDSLNRCTRDKYTAPVIYIELGNLYLCLKKWQEADNSFVSAVDAMEIKPSDLEIILEYYDKNKRLDHGLALLSPHILKHEEKNRTALWFEMGKVLSLKGAYEKALIFYNNAVDTISGKGNYCHYYNNIADCYFHLGNNNEAEKYYLKALEDSPDNKIIMNNLAALFCSTNQWKKADKAYKTLLNKKAFSIFTVSYLMKVLNHYSEHGRLEQGCSVFDPFIDRFKNPIEVYHRIALICFNAMEYRLAAPYFKKYLEGADEKADKGLAFYLAASANDQLGDKIEADSNFRKALSLDENNTVFLSSYISFLCKQQRQDDAKILIDQFEKKHSGSPAYFVLLGEYSKSCGDWGRARQMYQKALDQQESIEHYKNLIDITIDPVEKQRLTGLMIKKFPDNFSCLLEHNIREADRGHYMEALNALNKIRPHQENSLTVFYKLIALSMTDHQDEARLLLKNNEGKLKKEGSFFFVTGFFNFLENNYPEALSNFAAIPEYSNWYEYACMYRCKCLLAQKKYKDAEKLLQNIQSFWKHQEPDILLLSAEAQLLLNNFDRATAYLNEYSGYGKGDYASGILRAYLLYSSGNTDEARAAWDKQRKNMPATGKHITKWIGLSPQVTQKIIQIEQSTLNTKS
jgi:tetratricopeptide (TPR) repeat protein